MEDFFLGIDGGGTKTRCAIADERGKVIGEGLAGGCKVAANMPTRPAEKNVTSAVAGAIEKSRIQIQDITSACFGIPGFNSLDDVENARQLVKATLLTCPVRMEKDTKIAWAGALMCEPGVAVVSGNGFDVCGVSEEGEEIFGLGSPDALRQPGLLFGESGEELEHKLFYESLVAPQGAPLLQHVLDYFGFRTPDALLRSVCEGKFPLSKLRDSMLLLAVKAAKEGDASVLHILNAAGRTLGLAVVMIIKMFGIQKAKVSFIGGAFEICGNLLVNPFETTVANRFPEATIVFPKLKPVGGALLLAMHAIGNSPDNNTAQQITDSLAIRVKA